MPLLQVLPSASTDQQLIDQAAQMHAGHFIFVMHAMLDNMIHET
jgi:hypothetical protein